MDVFVSKHALKFGQICTPDGVGLLLGCPTDSYSGEINREALSTRGMVIVVKEHFDQLINDGFVVLVLSLHVVVVPWKQERIPLFGGI